MIDRGCCQYPRFCCAGMRSWLSTTATMACGAGVDVSAFAEWWHVSTGAAGDHTGTGKEGLQHGLAALMPSLLPKAGRSKGGMLSQRRQRGQDGLRHLAKALGQGSTRIMPDSCFHQNTDIVGQASCSLDGHAGQQDTETTGLHRFSSCSLHQDM